MLYTVQAGDTVSKLAIRFYGDVNRWREIAAANALQNPDLIRVGQQLTIPGLSTIAPGNDYFYPTSATTSLPPVSDYTGPTRNERGELVLTIDRSANVAPKAASMAPGFNPGALLDTLKKPAVLAAMALLAVLALTSKPKRRRSTRRRRSHR